MTRIFHRLLLSGGLAAATVSLAGADASAQASKYDTHDNDKHGFSLTYPVDKFVALPQATPDGFQAVSKDGNARLLVGTIPNFDSKSLADYRSFLLNAAYPGAKIDYAPVRPTWFVVTGVRKDGITAFYQRVNFVCGGRNINSWAVVFPYAQEPVYSRIIDRIHRDYAVGDGNCDRSVMMDPAKRPKQMGAMERVMSGAMEMEPKQMVAMEPTMQPKAMEPAMPPKQMAAIEPTMQPKQMRGGAAMGLATYNNEKHGFSLAYPTSQFLALPTATRMGSRRFQGRQGPPAGRHLANFDGKSLGAYRSFLINAAYPDAKLGDAPSRDSGFVLSGVKSDGTAFYHRVNFVCRWRNINSVSLLYPAQEKATYDTIIDQVDRNYVVGDGNCEKTAMR
jgi:hypothetical protein